MHNNTGIRNGCPISSILSLFVVEILSSKIKYNNQIHGIIKIKKNYNMKKKRATSEWNDGYNRKYRNYETRF